MKEYTDQLREALDLAASTFREYQHHHRAKVTPYNWATDKGHVKKAWENGLLAERFEKLLAQPIPAVPSGYLHASLAAAPRSKLEFAAKLLRNYAAHLNNQGRDRIESLAHDLEFAAAKPGDKVKTSPYSQHVLYTDADKDRPEVICDSNGVVVLGLCKRCGKGEVELEGPCAQPAKKRDLPAPPHDSLEEAQMAAHEPSESAAAHARSVADELVNERRRQIALGYDSSHDDKREEGEIAQGATDYIMPYQKQRSGSWAYDKSKLSRRRQLVIGAALAVAEIERLDRAEPRKEALVDALVDIAYRARELSKYADAKGYLVTVERQSQRPLVMGNHTPLIKVWPKRTPAQEPAQTAARGSKYPSTDRILLSTTPTLQRAGPFGNPPGAVLRDCIEQAFQSGTAALKSIGEALASAQVSEALRDVNMVSAGEFNLQEANPAWQCRADKLVPWNSAPNVDGRLDLGSTEYR